MSLPLDLALTPELDQLRAQDRLRTSHTFGGQDRAHPVAESGHPTVSFSTNDYLGLASHPTVVEAAARAALSHGVGAGAARLVTGETPFHRPLERSLAAFLQTEDALLFPSGYQTNIGVVTALAGPDDLIASDSANHASLIDGCRLSRARIAVYRHGDVESAERALASAPSARRRFLLTESLFSMDGDRAPLAELDTLCRQQQAHLIVDEAHALGCLGPSGRGLCSLEAVRPAVLIGTLGKALGSAGGFAAASRVVCSTLVNRARSYIYTTAAPGPILAAAAAALALALSPEGDRLRARLLGNVTHVHRGLAASGATQPRALDHIIPLLLGTDSRAMTAARRAADHGIVLQPMRPPTVPENTARLRLTLSAAHTPADLDLLMIALKSLDLGTPEPVPGEVTRPG